MSKKEDKNNQIIAAATEEFLQKGLAAASMHNIAKQAEVSKRTLYKYYSTKDELYSALVDEILDRVEDMYSFEYEEDQNIEEQIKKVIDAKIEHTLSASFLKINKIVIGEMLKGKMPNQEQFERLNKSELAFVEWIKQGQESKKVVSTIPAEQIAEQFHSILKGQIYWPILLGLESEHDIDLQKTRRNTLDFFINSFVK